MEMTSPTVAAVAAGGAGTMVAAKAASLVFGVPLDMLVWGTLGGLIAVLNTETVFVGFALMRFVMARMITGCVVGGAFSGIALPALGKAFTFLAGAEQAPLAPIASAVLVGAASAFLPDAFRWFRAWWNSRRPS